jgi:hypothetical protein
MSDTTPHSRHSDDARPDDGPPTDALTDEVREDAAEAGTNPGPGTDADPDSR